MAPKDKDITIPGGAEAVELIDQIGGEQAFTLADPKAAGLAIMQRIMDAETLDDVLSMSHTNTTDDLIGRPIMVSGAEWRKSTIEGGEGPGFYATITYRDYDVANAQVGEKDRVASVGGQNVLAQLAVIKKKNFFPFACKIIKTEKPTARGYYPLWLDAVA